MKLEFDNLAKYAGFLLTVISLVMGFDYFIHNKVLSLGLTAGVAVIFLVGYLIYRKKDTIDFELRIASHEVLVDIQDIGGNLAIHKRKTKFICLKDGITTFTDHMSVDGKLLEPQVTPGLIEDIRAEGGDLFVKANFGRVLKKGDQIERQLSAKLSECFIGQPEYWSVRIVLPTDEFKLSVIFPIERPYKNYRGFRRITSHEMINKVQPQETLIEGRPALVWQVKFPVVKDVYKLVWDW